MRLSFYLGIAFVALTGMTISGAQIWASIMYFGVIPTVGMYTAATVAVVAQVYLTHRSSPE